MADYVKHLRQVVGHGELLQLPSVAVALRDDDGRVLLARHVETGRWGLPGGGVEPGETPADAAVREFWEETGVFVRLTRLIGVFGSDDHIVHYRNGDRTSYVAATFEATAVSGRLRADPSELLEVRFVREAEISSLEIAPWMPEILTSLFRGGPLFRPATWKPSDAAR
ncbi:MAG TPA: NUDIX domain-containing protein [Vicinamibacterales bacterium]|jgi:8-oxo-dGTP pyrophosphatase MutT (NUDIX family)|nr:NUDIX domain-containing protein [Vicinamibacterales bacterium]